VSYVQAKLFAKLEDFARVHRYETKAGLVLMSFLNGDCEHMGNPCELCGHDKRDLDIDESEEP
jgi:hypothetical protein